MIKTLFLVALLLLANGCQIYTMNMNKAPQRRVTVLDADTGAPVEGVALVYCDIKKPYFIVSTIVMSRPYVSGPGGRVFVPRNVHLQTAGNSGYVIDSFRHPYPAKNAAVYYVRKLDSYTKLMEERLQRETNQ